jgi:hypothetical protein
MATQNERFLQGYNVPYHAGPEAHGFGKNPQGVSRVGDTRSSKPTLTIRKNFSFNPLENWRQSAIHESVGMMQPHTLDNIKMHNDAVKHINKMNAAKLVTMSSKDVAKLAHAMVKNKASVKHKGGKKKSRKSRKSMKSRKTRRNCK